MAKYFNSILRYFCFYTLAFLVFLLLDNVIRDVLCKLLPTVFPPYNPVTQKELFSEMTKNTSLVTGFVCVFVSTYFAVCLDGVRYERVISRTDGFYKIKEALPSYLSDFLLADAVSSVISPLPLVILTQAQLPEKVGAHIGALLSLTNAFVDKFGFLVGLFVIALFSFVCRLLFSILALRRFRGMWLADVE